VLHDADYVATNHAIMLAGDDRQPYNQERYK
jgi:hypothetical protein